MLERNDICAGPNCNKDNGPGYKKALKVLLMLFIITFLIFLIIAVLGMYQPEIEGFLRNMQAENLRNEAEADRKRMEDAMRSDIYGGPTPEETFDMFLGALSKNDYILSAKYYEVNVQDKALASLQKEYSENGNLGLSLSYFSDVRKGEKKCNEAGDGCVFEFVFRNVENEASLIDANFLSEDGYERKMVEMSLNDFNSVWKINRPF